MRPSATGQSAETTQRRPRASWRLWRRRLSIGFVLFITTLCLFASPRTYAQVPSCGAGNRHFDPAEVPAIPVGAGRAYYVDAAHGNDDNDGLSEARAFKTISRVAADWNLLNPGDTVRVKAGRYRERPRFLPSGTASARIAIGAYGDGPVVLDASTAVSGWTRVSGQVYKAPVSFPVTAVVVDEVPLLPEFSVAALAAGRYFYDSATQQLYIWGTNGGNPATRDVGVIKDDVSEVGLFLDHASYVTVYGITVRFSGGHGIIVSGDYVRIEKCRAIFNGKAGISWFSWGTVPATNGEIIKNEIYHNVMINWPRGRVKWGGWPPGASAQGTPNALFQGNVSHKNGGEGILTYLPGGAGTVIRDNIVYDNWSVNIYVDNQANAIVENNFVYSHAPDSGDLYNNGDTDPGDMKNFRRLRAEGIMTADENYSVSPPANLRNVTIANNVVVNCRQGITHDATANGSALKNVQVLGNTVVVAVPVSGESTLSGIGIPYNGGANVGSIYRDNIVYATNPSTYLLYSEDIPPSGDQFKGLTIDHNLFFHTSQPYAFHWGATYSATYDYTHAGWQGLSGSAHGAGDVWADPLLLSIDVIDNVQTKRPHEGSPALKAGTHAATLDYDFCSRSTTGPTLGAFESPGTQLILSHRQ